MCSARLVMLFVLLGCAIGSAAYSEAQDASNAKRLNGEGYTGTWSGTWDGAGSGDFELTLEKANDGALAGKVAVTTDGGNYTADFKSVSVDGNKMSAKYDFPLDPSGEVLVSGTFDERTAKGTWSLRPKGQDIEIAGGTWTVAKK